MARKGICLIQALLLWSALAACCGPAWGRETLSLEGSWRFQLDRTDSGLSGRWFEKTLEGRVLLPGTLASQGIGDPVTLETKWVGSILDRSFFTAPEYARYREPGRIKVPFWLQPETYYAGAAWYQRDIEIPASWKGQQILVFLERAHWETSLWIDDRLVGRNNALATPHEYDLGTGVAPGRHTLTLRVDNRIIVDLGENSHSISDHTQGNWNGIVGRMELVAISPVWIEELQAFPNPAARSVEIRGRIGNRTGRPGQAALRLEVAPGGAKAELKAEWQSDGGSFQAEIPLGPEARLWDEFHPFLYTISASLDSGRDEATASFGLRQLSTQGTRFLLNGQKIFFRGTLDCAGYPFTGHPPVDVESWRQVIRTVKAHGLNQIRFHSWCPPEAAFQAADELGFYFHVECSSWTNGLSAWTGQTTTLGDGKPVDRWIYEEGDRILKYYGNHPSFLLMLYGNEPGGKQHQAYLSRWVSHYRAKDPRRLYSSGAGWPQLPENQFHVTPDPRVQAWGSGLKSRLNALPPETRSDYRDYVRQRAVPVISHEIGQWCVYPNFDEIPKYQGYLKPRNFEIFRDLLQAHGMADQARAFLINSGKLQAICYKEDIESALRTPGMGGFQLLDLHDFPGQGTALVGILDAFWEPKGYISAAEFRRFCNSTVPLARLGKRVFRSTETLEAEIEVAHFGPEEHKQAVASWRIADARGRSLLSGRLPPRDLPIDNGIPMGSIRQDLGSLPAPARYRLVVALEGTPFENDWDFWVYPSAWPAGPAASEIAVTEKLEGETLSRLQNGGKVLLLIPPGRTAPDPKTGRVELGFSSIFWNTAWTKRQAPHTLGILCDPGHPALASFPTESHSNWQWWYLVGRSDAMILDGFPAGFRPLVQVIDDWFTARRLALAFEARLGNGKLLVCSMDLASDADANPVARQMRHSLLQYMAGPQFVPSFEVTVEQVRSLIQ